MAKKAAEESERLDEESTPSWLAKLLRQMAKGNLAKLGAAARAANNKVKRLTKNLHDSKLIDGDQLKDCEGKEQVRREMAWPTS